MVEEYFHTTSIIAPDDFSDGTDPQDDDLGDDYDELEEDDLSDDEGTEESDDAEE